MSDHFIRSSRSNIFHRITFKHGSTSVYWTFGILFSIILLGILAPIMPIQDPIKPNPRRSEPKGEVPSHHKRH